MEYQLPGPRVVKPAWGFRGCHYRLVKLLAVGEGMMDFHQWESVLVMLLLLLYVTYSNFGSQLINRIQRALGQIKSHQGPRRPSQARSHLTKIWNCRMSTPAYKRQYHKYHNLHHILPDNVFIETVLHAP